MMPYGHVGAAYLISQASALAGGNPLTLPEVLMVIIAANLPDLDFIYCLFKKRRVEKHHNYFTHTPIGVFLIWSLWFLTLGKFFSLTLNLILLAAILSHLILDDVVYWLYKFKLQEIVPHSQINWLYPFKNFILKSDRGNLEVLKEYLVKAKASFMLEAGLFLVSVVLFLKSFLF